MGARGLEEKIEAAATALWKPAGDAPQFATADLIRKNHHEFVLRCPETWKKWHLEAIKQIFFFEGWLRREKTNPIGQGVAEFGQYNKAIWRRVNDAIVWSVCVGQRCEERGG